MAEQDAKTSDPAAHQPSNADMDEGVGIDAAPEALARAATRGGVERQREDAVDR